MNHDDVLWSVMGQNFCSFKVMTRDDKVRFCRNPYNLTGLCSRNSCPLSNSQYATVIEHEDELFLYIKTAERAHLPRRQWEKVKLDSSFPVALAQIDEQLQWWDRRHVNKVKARLLRLKQYLMRKRKMLLEGDAEYVSVNKRQEFKLLRREEKAEAAARIELEIEKELLDRLKRGTYDSVINYDQQAFEKLLDEEEVEDEMATKLMQDEAEEEPEAFVPYVMEDEQDDDGDAPAQLAQDSEDARPSRRRRTTVRKRERLILEDEQEVVKDRRVESHDW